MLNLRVCALFLATTLVFISCCPDMYYVNDPVVHANVKKAGDFNLGAGLNVGNVTSGLHLHAIGAVSNKVFVGASVTGYRAECTDDNFFSSTNTSVRKEYSGISALGMAGYYRDLGKDFVLEVGGGAKYGKNDNLTGSGSVGYQHMKYFVQPGLSYNKEHFQAGVALRTGMISFIPDSRNPTPGNRSCIDPSFYLGFGGENVKLGIQVSTSITDDGPVIYNPAVPLFGFSEVDPLSVCLSVRFTITDRTPATKAGQ